MDGWQGGFFRNCSFSKQVGGVLDRGTFPCNPEFELRLPTGTKIHFETSSDGEFFLLCLPFPESGSSSHLSLLWFFMN